MSEPWRGRDYREGGLLLLGESAYSWEVDGKRVDPSPRHSIELVERTMRGDQGRFMTMLTRGLTGLHDPTPEQMEVAWARAAFTNYVPDSVGLGYEFRPTKEMWRAAQETFFNLLHDLRPGAVIVLGKTMWAQMPEADVCVVDDVQGYRLSGGQVAMCWAIRHPSRGLSWTWLANVIAFSTNCGAAAKHVLGREVSS